MNKNRWIAGALVLMLGAGAFVSYAVADDKPPGAKPAMQMPAWMQPTQEHKDLARGAGTFDCTYEFTRPMPMKGTGVAKGKMIMNGRFFEQTFDSTFMNKPWNARLTLGFDTLNKEFVSIWIDSGSPYTYVGRGKEKNGAVHYTGKAPEPTTGKIKNTYGITTWIDADTYTYEMGGVLDDGTKQKHGVMTYKRRKE